MWLLAASLAILVLGQELARGRRRNALNRGLHELRRPLQAMALAMPEQRLGGVRSTPGSMELALAALDDLDREVNGSGFSPDPAPVRCRELLEAAVLRCRGRAAAEGAEVRTRWVGGSALVVGDRLALAAALDNLLANAIEHGGPKITVAGTVRQGRLRMAVVDGGGEQRRPVAPVRFARFNRGGGSRHGHGLGVVRSVAADHGGRFAIQRSAEGAVAMLELPLAQPRNETRAA